MPRICILTSQYPPDMGGVGHSCHRVANYLASQGLDVHVLHFRKFPESLPIDEAVEMTSEGGVTVRRARICHPDWRASHAPGGKRTSESEVLTRYNREMFEIVSALQTRHRFDLLHGFFLYPAGFIATTAARYHGTKSIVSIRGNDIGKYMLDPLRMEFVASSLRNSDYVTSVAGSLLDMADRAIHDISGRSRVILNSIPPEQVKSGAKPDLRLRGTVIGTAGLMRYKKGLVYLFKALARLRYRYEFTLLLAGDFFNPEEEQIHLRQLDELGLRDRTVITGRLSRAEMFDHFPLYDVLVFPSLFAEGCPLSMMEAMTMGRAIIGSRTGAIPEILKDGESGLLVEPGDSEAIERALVRLLESPNERKRLGAGARARSSELSPEHELGEWLEVYREVLGGHVGAEFESRPRLVSTA